MNWKKIESPEDLKEINKKSFTVPQLIFKHSTRCSVSSMALSRIERMGQPNGIEMHILDLLAFRSISNQIANDYNVRHESPQILLIKNEKCIYSASHGHINMAELTTKLK